MKLIFFMIVCVAFIIFIIGISEARGISDFAEFRLRLEQAKIKCEDINMIIGDYEWDNSDKVINFNCIEKPKYEFWLGEGR